MTLSVQVPSSARAADGDIIGVAVLTNSSSDPIAITTRAEASGSLSDGGIVASEALDAPEAVQTVEIAAGDRFEFPLRVSTAACGGDTLGPGEFSVISTLEVVVQSTGQSVVLVAHPLTVRLD